MCASWKNKTFLRPRPRFIFLYYTTTRAHMRNLLEPFGRADGCAKFFATGARACALPMAGFLIEWQSISFLICIYSPLLSARARVLAVRSWKKKVYSFIRLTKCMRVELAVWDECATASCSFLARLLYVNSVVCQVLCMALR